MMKRKSLRLLLIGLLMLVFSALIPLTVSAAELNISVIVDGTKLEFDVPPMVINQRTMVPLRSVFEFLGAEVQWIQEENGIRSTTDTLDLYMQLGNPQMTVNGEIRELDVAPCAVNERTLIPLRAVAEAFSAQVTWEQDTTSVVIQTYDPNYAKELDQTDYTSYNARQLRTSASETDYFDLRLTGNKLRVLCKTSDPDLKAFAVRFNKEQLIGITEIIPGKRCSVLFDLDELNLPDHASVEIFTRKNDDTLFYSYIYRCLYLEKDGSTYRFNESEILEHNRQILGEWVDPRTYLDDTIPESIAALSDTICEGITDNYQKVLKIHDWVAENLYYDMDAYYDSSKHSFAGVEDLLDSRHSVCEGYADLVTLLIRAQGIPCRQIIGYALGMSTSGYWTENTVKQTKSNHAWNQAYVDHRWVNIDATWDSNNIYQNGQYIYGGIDNHLYFDTSNLFLSYNHKILDIR